jgi:hypothetical protein
MTDGMSENKFEPLPIATETEEEKQVIDLIQKGGISPEFLERASIWMKRNEERRNIQEVMKQVEEIAKKINECATFTEPNTLFLDLAGSLAPLIEEEGFSDAADCLNHFLASLEGMGCSNIEKIRAYIIKHFNIILNPPEEIREIIE